MQSIEHSGLAELCQSVQYNCDVSDARFARDYTLCIYLLRMREFYRWKNGISLGAAINAEALGLWVSDTEAYWDEIEETEFQPLILNGVAIDPFDADKVNQQLADSGLVYSAGIGRLGQPHFVLASLQEMTIADGTLCIECGEELARDTITVPAMAQNRSIFIRHESISHLLWQMIDEWSVKKPQGPMARLVEHYAIDTSSADLLDLQITSASTDLSALLRHHEFGEVAAGDELGEGYTDLMLSFQGTRGEMQLRAVRDLLADSLHSWPFIVAEQSSHHLDFWLAGLTGYREMLLKQAAVLDKLQGECSRARLQALADLITPEQTRWRSIAMQLIEQHRTCGENLDIEATINHSLGNPS